MYYLNGTNRYSNANATEMALKLLSDTNCPKLISLIKARYLEQNYHYEKIPILNEYTSYSIFKRITGGIKNESDIPEEYKQYILKRPSTSIWGWWNSIYSSYDYYINNYINVENDCKYEDTLKYKNEDLPCGIKITYDINSKIDWDKILDDILSSKLDLTKLELTQNTYQQFANQRFHPPSSMNDIFTKNRKAELSKLCILLDLEFPQNLDIMNVTKLVTELENKLFLRNPVYKIDVKRKHNNYVDKKHTYKAEYTELATDKTFLPKIIRNEKTYKYYVKLVGTIKGRLYNMFLPCISASSLIIDKTGLAMFGSVSKDPLTEALVVLLMASMSYQKLFTIDSQMHGGIDKWLKAYLDLLTTEYANTTDFEKIFRILPSPRLIHLIPKDKLENIYNYVIDWLKLFSTVFEQQWNLGVKNCVEKNMLVPRSGTTEINVNAWNACAGAWGNLTRYVRLIDSYLDREPLQIFKVLKMTAGDQMKWAEESGKSTDPDCEIFKTLILELNILPWSNLHGATNNYVEQITQTCNKYGVNANKWLGTPKERKAENRSDMVSVCGVVVEPDSVQLCKENGFFGSKPFNSE